MDTCHLFPPLVYLNTPKWMVYKCWRKARRLDLWSPAIHAQQRQTGVIQIFTTGKMWYVRMCLSECPNGLKSRRAWDFTSVYTFLCKWSNLKHVTVFLWERQNVRRSRREQNPQDPKPLIEDLSLKKGELSVFFFFFNKPCLSRLVLIIFLLSQSQTS